jgi:hypothetical protein
MRRGSPRLLPWRTQQEYFRVAQTETGRSLGGGARPGEAARLVSPGRCHSNERGHKLPVVATTYVCASIIDFGGMSALRAGCYLVHALQQQNGITVNLEGSIGCVERVESQTSRGDRGEEHRFRGAHTTIVDANEVVGVQPRDCRSIRPDEREPKRIVDGANAAADGVGVAGSSRAALGVANAGRTGAKQKRGAESEAARNAHWDLNGMVHETCDAGDVATLR